MANELRVFDEVTDCALGNTVIQRSDYRSLVMDVEPGKTYIVQRGAIEGNRFRIAETVVRPARGVAFHRMASVDGAMSCSYTVSDGYHWIIVYLSNQGDAINPADYWVEREAAGGGGGSMTTFAQGHATNLARNSGGAIVDNLDGASPSSQGYRPEYAYFDMGNSLSFESAVRLTVSFDLVMTVANANPTLTVYNTNNKGPMQFGSVNALSGETHAAGETIEKRVAVTSSWSPRSDANRQTNYLEFYSTYGTGNYFSISNLMVELGDVAHPWSPSPLDEGVTGMIKASAEVTVYDQTDVVGIAQWHFATTSTTVPSKPATTDASATPSGWSRTEPTIASDSDLDKYVYVCVQTVWGDGSCTWGDVFLSASFEAAKRAYNKADNAQAAAGAVEDFIGPARTITGDTSGDDAGEGEVTTFSSLEERLGYERTLWDEAVSDSERRVTAEWQRETDRIGQQITEEYVTNDALVTKTSELADTIDGIQANFTTTVEGLATNAQLGEVDEEVTKLTSFVHVTQRTATVDGVEVAYPEMTLGSDDEMPDGTPKQPVKARMTNSGLDFEYKGEVVASIHADADGRGVLQVANATATDEIHMGSWLIYARGNGNLSFKYVG